MSPDEGGKPVSLKCSAVNQCFIVKKPKTKQKINEKTKKINAGHVKYTTRHGVLLPTLK